jgi:hypothetical protein
LQQWGVARNSTATYFDANGVLQTAGINEPRIDYDPATGECRGLLVEPQATRLNLYPTQFDNAGWGKLNGDTVLQNSSIAPDGTLAAYKIVSSTAGGYHGVRQIVTLQPGFYVISCYFKKSDYRYGWISDNAFSRFRAAFDLDTGLVTQLEGSVNCGAVSATVEPVVGGFFRFSIVIECFSADLSIGYSFYGASVGSSTLIGGAYYTGDGISGIYIWGAQLEQGSKPTSLILGDESAQVTRVADIITPTV